MTSFRNQSARLVAITFLCWIAPRSVHAGEPPTFSIAVPENSLTKNTINSPAVEEIPSIKLQIKETDLWCRIRNGFAIPNLENQLVSQQTAWYSARPDYIQRTVQRGSIYLFHVVEELEKRGMPTELALLPFIESAFNPHAISSAKASGMWQFMAATGRDFNLRQNIFKDDRRGVVDSTDAALNYLEKLYGIFGDWQLVLAAYDWGQGSVQRAIKKQQALGLPIDFNSLSALMPTETKNYLPKLQAVKNIIGDPEQFHIDLAPIDNIPYFISVEKTRDIDVRVAAKLAELSLGEFTALNPQFNRPVITGSNNTKILLPTDNAVLFKENLINWRGPLSTWATHLVNKSERVELLASRLGIRPDILREANTIPAKMMVKSGSTLLIPKSTKSPDRDISADIADNAQLVIEKPSSKSRQLHVKVGQSDTFSTLAKRYKVSVGQLKNWNHLKRDTLVAGQSLIVESPYAQLRTKSHKALLVHAKTGKKHQG